MNQLADSMLKQARIMTPHPKLSTMSGEDVGRIQREGLVGKPVHVLAKLELGVFTEMLCVYPYPKETPWARTVGFLDFFATRARRIRDKVGGYNSYKITAYPQEFTEELACSSRKIDEIFSDYCILLIREEFLVDTATSNQEAKKLLTKFKGDM